MHIQQVIETVRSQPWKCERSCNSR